ncbi:MAG: hypothetical protein KAS87_03070 [Candidatus Omnitrophica bacterium]|nr:hypothetical protein [Candidatus Omnitrophota bacterium]
MKNKIGEKEIEEFLGHPFSDMIKFVVDLKREIIALGGELHSDGEALLLEDGSKQQDLWGGNFYPKKEKKIEYSSLINIRPSVENNSLEVQDIFVQEKMKDIISKLLPEVL